MKKILIANRGEIALRIQNTIHELGHQSIAVYSEADRFAPHVLAAHQAHSLGPAPVKDSYLCQDKILAIAQKSGAHAIHPGYGLLSENADFAQAVEAQGIAFIGPTPQQMQQFGLKHAARELAQAAGVPCLSGSPLLQSLDQARALAQDIGYPVMLKSTAGGGGIGMAICHQPSELDQAYQRTLRLAHNHFGQADLFLEKFIAQARHVEVQLFGDGQGHILPLGDRDCSLQRRNQKVVEECPAPNLPEPVRQNMQNCAIALGQSVQYRSAGTVEYIYDAQTEQFYFLEMNTRLQVEHGVTEACYRVDLVAWMIQLALGESDFLPSQTPPRQGHAVETRLYAEDPYKDFQPSSGLLTQVEFPEPTAQNGLRLDSWIAQGETVTPYYDPLLAKVIIHQNSRKEAIQQLQNTLHHSKIYGLETNLEYLGHIISQTEFKEAQMHTHTLDALNIPTRSIDILDAGPMTTIQDYPGRLHYWNVGIPPSGAMDPLSLQAANALIGNPPHAPALEMTLSGPSILFQQDSLIALVGAHMPLSIDGQALPFDQSYQQALRIQAGQTLSLGPIQGPGMRCYLAIAGGFDVPAYLGSASTFTLGQFGGHCGRALQNGDVLHIGTLQSEQENTSSPPSLPSLTHHWTIQVQYGPHGAPDFFTPADIDTLLQHPWEVHYNSARTGVRLIGPKPQWARSDGGEAGLHPSNIHDNAYAIGAIDFTGDMPIILGPDGPSLGGFVCPLTIIQEELWKIGQLKPGDTIHFTIAGQAKQQTLDIHSCILHRLSEQENPVAVCYRRSGDANLLIEYGDMVLDLNLRFRVHALMQAIEQQQKTSNLPHIIDITPGIRSLQIHYQPDYWSLPHLVDQIIRIEQSLPAIEDMTVATRVVHLPLSWDDPSTQLATERYSKAVRSDAPWCPSNLEFIRRINGLDSIEDVKKIVFDARYLVLGLGDVYLGAPVATPLDPRHRLVTTKYNPARTWTPANAVGIGGAYLCIYGMEGPGGYQFVGRTLQMWNKYFHTTEFPQGTPWLLRFFDQIRFYPVSSEELSDIREKFPRGLYPLKIEEEEFSLQQYNQFLSQHQADIHNFRQQQQSAFAQERARWEASGQDFAQAAEEVVESSEQESPPPGSIAITSPTTGSLWQLPVQVGDPLDSGDTLAILEAMKMEINVPSPQTGVLTQLFVQEGKPVQAGQTLAWLEIAKPKL